MTYISECLPWPLSRLLAATIESTVSGDTHKMADKTVDFHTLRFDVSDERRVRFTVASLQTDGELVLGGELGLCIPARTTGMRVQEESNYVKIAWDDYAHVEIFHGALDGGGHSYNVRWLVDKNGKSALSDQFDMKDAHWYGAAQVRSDHNIHNQTSRQWSHSAYHHCHNLLIDSKWTVWSGMLAEQRDYCLRLVTSSQL